MPMVSKVEAARRQLDAAIQHWLDESDMLVIHTLHMAAFGILDDLHRLKDPYRHELFWNSLPKEVVDARRRVANFLKHADRDPHARIEEPSPDHWEASIGLTVAVYRCVSGNALTSRMTAFDLMMKSVWPEHFQIATDEDPDIEAGAQLGAELMRESRAMRQTLVKALVTAIDEGALEPGADLKRKLQKKTESLRIPGMNDNEEVSKIDH